MSAPAPVRPVPLRLHLSWGFAAVPGFAPVGAEAADYEQHRWGPDPLPEVIAHHATHWPHIERMADFAPLLRAEGFDAAAIVALAEQLGLDRLVVDAADGQPVITAAWNALRTQAADHGITVDEVAPAVIGAAPQHHDPLQPPPIVTVLPEVAPTKPWVLRRALGPSFGWNEAEESAHLLAPSQVLDLLTRVVAWGGTLALTLPLRADGSLPPDRLATMQTAATWLTEHREALYDVDRFDVAGNADVRYTARPGTEPGTRDVYLIDLLHRPQLTIGHFSPHRYPILDVAGSRLWKQDTAGIHLIGVTRTDADIEHSLPTVHRLTVRDKRLVNLTVIGQRTPGRVTIDDVEHLSIGAALAVTQPGDTVRLTPGRYGPETEQFPLVVPAGVTVAGTLPGEVTEGAPFGLAPGDEGTLVELAGQAPGTAALVLGGDGAALERLTVRRPPRTIESIWDRWPVITAAGVSNGRVEQCIVVGDVAARECPNLQLAWNRFEGGGITIEDSPGAAISGNITDGGGRGTGITVTGGSAQRIDGNHLAGYEHGIVVRATLTATVTGNDVAVRQDAIRIADAHDTEVVANHVRGGRALTVHAGSGTALRANTAAATDVGLLLTAAPQGTELGRNRFDDCRVDVLGG